MKKVFCGTLLVYLLAGLLAFDMAPATAQAMSNQSIESLVPANGPKGPVANPGEKPSSQGASHETKSRFHSGKTAADHSIQAQGREATVARVNRLGKCLRVYSHPSPNSKRVSCLAKGEKVHLNGMFSKDKRWAQLDNQGWVLFRNLKTNVKAHRTELMNKQWSRTSSTARSH